MLFVQFVSEASATLKRRAEGTAEDVWLKSNLYPDYYLNTFHFQVMCFDVPAIAPVPGTVPHPLLLLPGDHALPRTHACTRIKVCCDGSNPPRQPGGACKPVRWMTALTRGAAQTDGWLSEQSAKVYEVSTETLFLGRQDAMQRQTLVPLHKFVMSRPAGSTGLRALEIAAGTGRFATFIKVARAAETLGKLILRQYMWEHLSYMGTLFPLCSTIIADMCVSCFGRGLCCAELMYWTFIKE